MEISWYHSISVGLIGKIHWFLQLPQNIYDLNGTDGSEEVDPEMRTRQRSRSTRNKLIPRPKSSLVDIGYVVVDLPLKPKYQDKNLGYHPEHLPSELPEEKH